MSKEGKEGKEQKLKQVIKIVRGNEQSVRITGDLCDSQYFMYASYRQALRALAEIVRQTDYFHENVKKNPDDLDVALFCYNDNIIMFEGSRGRGKTQTMLSFTRILRNASGHRCHATNDRGLDWNKEIDFLEEADRIRLAYAIFHVIPPISPSVLEEKQNILFLILSRLYDYAVNLLENAHDYDEDDRNKLSRLFSACLSGIKGIKQGLDNYTELSDLQTISDGAALRNRFYSLVQFLIQIDASKSGAKKTYLVVQIDDADSQIKNGYKAIEDIRKYLVIPNLIIVMSADITFLHKVIIHEQGIELDGLCHKFEEFSSELSQMSRKYIDKLIPPSHMIHLPKLEQLIENNPDSVVIKYIIEEKPASEDEESVFTWMKKDEDWDIQNMLFMLIYRKTGVVFVRPSAYLHNIVPRSIRGLNQMLYFLSIMEDIPQLEKDAWTDSPTLALKIQEQLRIAMPNMEAFERYFYSDWIEAKFHHSGDRQFIREFIRSAGSNRVRLAIGYLQKRYSIVNNRFRGNRIELDALLAELEAEHREQEDFLLFFSIRTVLTLASHRKTLQHKMEKTKKYLEDWSSYKAKMKQDGKAVYDKLAPLLVFDYNPNNIYLPKTYMIPRYYPEIHTSGLYPPVQILAGENDSQKPYIRDAIMNVSNDTQSSWRELFKSEGENEKNRFLETCMICENETGNPTIHFMNLITFMLRIGRKDIVESAYGDSIVTNRQERQYALFTMQEIALLIAANWDVQVFLYKYLAYEIRKKKTSSDLTGEHPDDINMYRDVYSPSELYEAIDNTLNRINTEAFQDCVLLLYRRDKEGNPLTATERYMLKKAYLSLKLRVASDGNGAEDPLVRGLDLTHPFAQRLVGAEWGDIPERARHPKKKKVARRYKKTSSTDNQNRTQNVHEESESGPDDLDDIKIYRKQKHDEKSKGNTEPKNDGAAEEQ